MATDKLVDFDHVTDYISREAALDFHIQTYDLNISVQDGRILGDRFGEFLKSIPAADVQHVVTCEECVWHVDDGCHNCTKLGMLCPDDSNFYCKYGRRSNCKADTTKYDGD